MDETNSENSISAIKQNLIKIHPPKNDLSIYLPSSTKIDTVRH